MRVSNDKKVFATRPPADFVGREAELARLWDRAESAADNFGIALLAAPGAGASELLRQTYDRLFHGQRKIIPFYFPVRRNLANGREFAEEFLQEFVRQLVAFRRHDASIVRSAAGLDELAELSLSVSGIWIDRLITTARNSSDGRGFLRTCLSAPVRAAANGDRAMVMIDDVHHLMNFDEGANAFQELRDVLEHGSLKFVVSGYRRSAVNEIDADRMELDNFDPRRGAELVELFARESGREFTDQSRDLVATQLGGNPMLIRLLARDAQNTGTGLHTFEEVQKAYAYSIYGGRIARRFREMSSAACGAAAIERDVVRILDDLRLNEDQRLDQEHFGRMLQISAPDADALLDRLNEQEFINLTPNSVEAIAENLPLSDYLSARVKMLSADSRAIMFGESLAEFIKRAPEIMAKHYRAHAAIGVRELLAAFDGRRVATLLLDYGEFRDEFNATPDQEVLDAAKDAVAVALPRIFFTTSAASFYKPLSQISEAERSAIALGFEARDDEANHEIVWIAAEIDSKLEADTDLVTFWCGWLEAAGITCGFAEFKIWLIAPEGFTPAALDVLKKRGAYGSSRRQADLLRRWLNAPLPRADELAPNEYEIVIPMDTDAELIAAHAVEEISRRHDLDSKTINHLKTALIEACINASEHSLSPDRKIYQRFRVDDDRVVLTVSNRGLRLDSKKAPDQPDDTRRGWGLKLMRRLMDEVTVEQVDDGTRIVMTKYLKAA